VSQSHGCSSMASSPSGLDSSASRFSFLHGPDCLRGVFPAPPSVETRKNRRKGKSSWYRTLNLESIQETFVGMTARRIEREERLPS
jgi:hypothetical protein